MHGWACSKPGVEILRSDNIGLSVTLDDFDRYYLEAY